MILARFIAGDPPTKKRKKYTDKRLELVNNSDDPTHVEFLQGVARSIKMDPQTCLDGSQAVFVSAHAKHIFEHLPRRSLRKRSKDRLFRCLSLLSIEARSCFDGPAKCPPLSAFKYRYGDRIDLSGMNLSQHRLR